MFTKGAAIVGLKQVEHVVSQMLTTLDGTKATTTSHGDRCAKSDTNTSISYTDSGAMFILVFVLVVILILSLE